MKNEWIIQTYVDLSIPSIARSHIPFMGWTTWKGENTTADMRPISLEEATERAANFIQLVYAHETFSKTAMEYRFRLFNVNTGEEIPLDALGL